MTEAARERASQMASQERQRQREAELFGLRLCWGDLYDISAGTAMFTAYRRPATHGHPRPMRFYTAQELNLALRADHEQCLQ